MKTILCLMFSLTVCGCHKRDSDDGRSPQQREQAKKTDETAKKGALRKKADPAEDLKQQSANLERLRTNEKESRENGNHIAAWAAAQDIRQVEKIIAKDRETLAGESSR